MREEKNLFFFKTISFLDGFLLSPLVLLAGVKIVISTFLITTILFLILYFVSTLINEEKANFLRDLALWIFLIYFLLFLASFILPLFGIIGNNYLFEFFIPFFLGIGFVAITIYDFKEISIS